MPGNNNLISILWKYLLKNIIKINIAATLLFRIKYNAFGKKDLGKPYNLYGILLID
jgi:hypothetical protein